MRKGRTVFRDLAGTSEPTQNHSIPQLFERNNVKKKDTFEPVCVHWESVRRQHVIGRYLWKQ